MDLFLPTSLDYLSMTLISEQLISLFLPSHLCEGYYLSLGGVFIHSWRTGTADTVSQRLGIGGSYRNMHLLALNSVLVCRGYVVAGRDLVFSTAIKTRSFLYLGRGGLDVPGRSSGRTSCPSTPTPLPRCTPTSHLRLAASPDP